MAPAEVIVREAEPQDVLLVTRFVVAMARDSEGIELDEEVVEAAVRTALADRARGVYYVAEAAEGLIGQALVTTEWSDWHCCEYWWLQSVYVLPAWRGRGVFDAVHRHIAQAARDAYAAAIRLYVHRDNRRARRAYERLGMCLSDYVVYEQPL